MSKFVLNNTMATKRDLIDGKLYELLMNGEDVRFFRTRTGSEGPEQMTHKSGAVLKGLTKKIALLDTPQENSINFNLVILKLQKSKYSTTFTVNSLALGTTVFMVLFFRQKPNTSLTPLMCCH